VAAPHLGVARKTAEIIMVFQISLQYIAPSLPEVLVLELRHCAFIESAEGKNVQET